MPKIAWVLSGGGVKGSFQAGVMSQLIKEGVKPDIILGTSVGAINGLIYSYGKDLQKYWYDIKGSSEILYPNGIEWLWNFHRFVTKSGIYSLHKLRAIIEHVLETGEVNTHFFPCYVDLPSGHVKYVSNLSNTKKVIIDSVLASASIPILMEAVNDGVDGGVRDHTPIKKAIELGATEIYIIICKPLEISTWNKKRNIYNILFRVVDDIMSHEIFINDLRDLHLHPEVKFHFYKPDREWMDTLDFDPKKIRNAFEAGLIIKESPVNQVPKHTF